MQIDGVAVSTLSETLRVQKRKMLGRMRNVACGAVVRGDLYTGRLRTTGNRVTGSESP